MSLKWQRSRAWDDANIPAWLWPAKVLLRVMSSVWMGVGLLVFVVLYAILASVPIGMLAKIPTYLIYGASIFFPVTVVAVVLAIVLVREMSKRKVPTALRFVIALVVGLSFKVVATWAWYKWAWPNLKYDPDAHKGLMLFADFVQKYPATTVRRLPGFEMSELEFYAWWPLRIVLLAFVANMIVATLRRIEFTFRNIGVLTVHTGIVTIALGSIYYSGLKLEGDTVLFAGRAGSDGVPVVGPAQDRFYDNTRVALYVSSGLNREQRPMRGVPRYNDYGLDRVGPAGAKTAWDASFRRQPEVDVRRSLDVPVMVPPQSQIDPAIQFRVVGYASYATGVEDWIEADPATGGGRASVAAGEGLNALRVVYLHSEVPDATGKTTDRPVLAYTLLPSIPARRVAASAELGVEYTMGSSAGMSESRWRDLSEELPPQTEHALVVEVPGKAGGEVAGFRAVYAVKTGTEIAIGQTGYRLSVKELAAQPPFPIITKGYANATSSVAIVRVTDPDGKSFDRWVYHRFGEINQDMLDEQNASGMPKRRDADPAIRISYVDSSPLLQVYFDEPKAGVTRAIVRSRGGAVRVVDAVTADELALVPKLTMKIGARWVNATAIQRPMPVPEAERDKSMIGTHDQGMLGVEVSSLAPDYAQGASPRPWSTVVWLPFMKYVGTSQGAETEVTLPDGRQIGLAFGRQQHRLPSFAVQLVDFKMISYDHRGAPRDYQSTLRVTSMEDFTGWGGGARGGARRDGTLGAPAFASFEHVTQLNAPLTAPFHWEDERPWVVNFFGRLKSGLSPFQFKFSQAGWDQQGWTSSQAQVDRGLAKQPSVGFTILGVGNSPGIHMIALGGTLMGVGIPWAFYVKPYLVRREKKKIQQQLAAGTYKKPTRPGAGSAETFGPKSDAMPGLAFAAKAENKADLESAGAKS